MIDLHDIREEVMDVLGRIDLTSLDRQIDRIWRYELTNRCPERAVRKIWYFPVQRADDEQTAEEFFYDLAYVYDKLTEDLAVFAIHPHAWILDAEQTDGSEWKPAIDATAQPLTVYTSPQEFEQHWPNAHDPYPLSLEKLAKPTDILIGQRRIKLRPRPDTDYLIGIDTSFYPEPLPVPSGSLSAQGTRLDVDGNEMRELTYGLGPNEYWATIYGTITYFAFAQGKLSIGNRYNALYEEAVRNVKTQAAMTTLRNPRPQTEDYEYPWERF
jgi:hypothetical protein